MGFGQLHIPLQMFAICITLFIYHYYCLFSESSEDVPRRYFVVVRGKTTINAVCANLAFPGGGNVLLTEYTPGLAWSVQLTPLTRFKAICFAWVIEEIDIACISIGF